MPQIVTTPMSYLEVLIPFRRPNVHLWLDRATVVQGLFNVFARWNVNVDDVEILTSGKPSEQGIKFRVPEKLVTFFFNGAECRFTRDNTNWETAAETIEILDAGLSTLMKLGAVEAAKYRTIVSLHIQPKNVPFIDILKSLIPSPMAALEAEAPRTMASVVAWNKRKVTIDGSAAVANGIFIRFEREFSADLTYQEIGHQLKADEDCIFAMLDVQEEA